MSRIQALLHCATTFLGGGRAEQAITLRQLMGRVAISEVGDRHCVTDLIPIDGEA
jgi:hypothetical protein